MTPLKISDAQIREQVGDYRGGEQHGGEGCERVVVLGMGSGQKVQIPVIK